MVATRNQVTSGLFTTIKQKQVKKAQERTTQQQAFSDLLLQKHLNGGNLRFGDVQKVVNDYQSMGFD
jgi:hypothetical protein